MNIKTVVGWSILLIISAIPVFLWLYLGPGTADLTDYGSITHSLGELFALVGATMFALTFILSTRIDFIEDIFGGLDKVYIAHGILGGTALILLLFHPIFLVLRFIPANMPLAASYLLPSSYWEVNFGINALIGILGLIFVTLFTKLKYNRWKFTHEFLGLIFAVAILHIFLVKGTVASDYIFNGYYVYASIVALIGFSGFAYSLFVKGRLMKNAVYKISNIKTTKDFFEISMVPENKPISYKSGQFIFVRFFNENLSNESHPFSIASKSNHNTIKIVVKKLGDYTSRMESLHVGDKVAIEGPYGRFNYKNYGHDQVWIAGGIGITPFLGMVQDLSDDKTLNDKVYLYYSAKTDTEFIGFDLLKDIASKTNKFNFTPWNSSKQGYITAGKIFDAAGKSRNKEFFLCGPPQFKNSIINDLLRSGIAESHIHEEVFDFR